MQFSFSRHTLLYIHLLKSAVLYVFLFACLNLIRGITDGSAVTRIPTMYFETSQ